MFIYYTDRSDGGSGETSVESGQTITRIIDAESDTADISAVHVLAVLAYLGVFKGSAHPHYSFARATRIRADRTDDPLIWVVTAEYVEPAPTYGEGTLYPGDDPGGSEDGSSPPTPNPQPEDRPPTLKVIYRRKDTYPTVDLDGNVFENPAGDRFDNPPPVPRTMEVVTFTTWRAADGWERADGRLFLEKVNSLAWRGCAAYTACVVGLEATLKLEGGQLAWELNWTIEVGDQQCETLAWEENTPGYGAYADTVRIPAYGYNALTTGGDFSTKKEIVGSDNKPLASPAKLNANGTVRTANLDPLCRDFRVREAVNFAGL